MGSDWEWFERAMWIFGALALGAALALGWLCGWLMTRVW